MAGSGKRDLVSALRSRIADDRAVVLAFSLSVTGQASAAIVDVSRGVFRVSVEGGSDVASINWSLSLPQYSTVGRLVTELQKQKGYAVTLPEAFVADRPSSDLAVEGLPDISKKGVAGFKHRLFSDSDLERILAEATSLHNPNYANISAVPVTEHAYILLKASAIVYRTWAADVARRAAVDTDATDLIRLAQDAERQYEADTVRLHRIIPSPKADESKMGTGDIVLGHVIRRSLRGGGMSPERRNNPPTPPKLYDFADGDVEDFSVRLRWSPFREEQFSHYEVWRDTKPQVERSLSNAKDVTPDASSYFNGSSVQVAGRSDCLRVEQTSWVDSSAFIEPGATYYYRVYVVDANGEVAPSEVKCATTKRPRSRFLQSDGKPSPTALSVRTGPLGGGTVVTVTGSYFDVETQVFLAGKKALTTYVSASTLTFVVPAFLNPAIVGTAVSVTLRSGSGLEETLAAAWSYT